MHDLCFVWQLVAIAFLLLIGAGIAAGEEDPDLAVQTNAASAINYVRQSEIEAFADVSPSNCILLLTDGEDMTERILRVFQKCASIAAALQNKSLISFPNEFGTVFFSPPLVSDLLSTSNPKCRLNLKNGKHVVVNQSCASVHQALPRE